MATNFRYPLGAPSVEGPDRVITSLQERIRRQTNPKDPPEWFNADPWVVPEHLWLQAQTTEIQNLANSEAIRNDTEDLRVNFDIEALRTSTRNTFARPPMAPLKEDTRAELAERQRAAMTIREIQEKYPGVAAPVQWDDGTPALMEYARSDRTEVDERTLRERVMNRGRVNGGTESLLTQLGTGLGHAFDGRGLVKELTTWTTAWAADPTLNPEEWAKNKKAWEQPFDNMYENLPRPAQIFIEEMNAGNVAITIGSGGLSTVLRASGSPIARAIGTVLTPLASHPAKAIPLEIAAATGARVGYEETDGAPLPLRLVAGAAGAIVVANPKAAINPLNKAVKQVWHGLTDVPELGIMQGDAVLRSQFFPRPPAIQRTLTDGPIPIPDVVDLPVPEQFRSMTSPVRYAAPELADTALARAQDLSMATGIKEGFASGSPVPPNAAHALARAESAVEYSGNNRFLNFLNFGATDDKIIRQAYWAEHAASSEIGTRIFPSRIKFLDWVQNTFGSTRNVPDFMEYVGPPERPLWGDGILSGSMVPADQFPTAGTIVDAIANPQYYTWGDLNADEVVSWMRWWNQRNLRVSEAARGYGAEVGDFSAPQWGDIGEFFFPTINRQSQIANVSDPNMAARAMSGRFQEREFADLFERLSTPLEQQGGAMFEPELDFANAFTALDNAKSMAAGRNTFRLGLGGSLEPRAGWKRVPQLSTGNNQVWLPESQIPAIEKYLGEEAGAAQFFNWLNILKNGHLNGDFSPLTIQGSLQWFASPYDASAQLIAAARRGDTFRAFTPEYVAEQIAADPEGWTKFAFWMGMNPQGGTPQEFRTGLLEMIPGVGKKIGQWNDNFMSVLMQAMKREFDDQAAMLIKEGFPEDAAYSGAADVVRMIVPMRDSRKLGLSQTGNAIQRGMVTSTSFITQPIQFTSDAMAGYLKLGAKIPDELIGVLRRGARNIDDVVNERLTLQTTLSDSFTRLDDIEDLMRTTTDAAVRADLRAERNVISNSVKSLSSDIESLLDEESTIRLTSRRFSSGTREAWATLTPRERAASQSFAKMAGTITGLSMLSAMFSAEERGLTIEEAIQRQLPGQPDFWRIWVGPDFSVPIGGAMRSLYQGIAPGNNGIPFENILRYGHSKVTPSVSGIMDLVRNEDYYRQQIRSGNFAQQVFQSLAYAAQQVAPISVTAPFELAGQGFSTLEVAAQSAGQMLGQNITPPSHYERLERARRNEAFSVISDPSSWESRGLSQEQMTAMKSVRNLAELREAIGTRAANHLVEYGNPNVEDAIADYITQLERRAKGGDKDAEALLVSVRTQRQLEAARIEAVDGNGELDKALYRTRRGEIISQMIGQSEAFKAVFEKFGQSDNEIDRLSAEWFDLFDRATVTVEVNGKEEKTRVDYEAFNYLEERFFDRIGQEKAALVEANVAVAPRGANPAEVELRDVRHNLEVSGFWNVEKGAWSEVRKGFATAVSELARDGALDVEEANEQEQKDLLVALATSPTYQEARIAIREFLSRKLVDAGINSNTAVQMGKQMLTSMEDIRAIDELISERKVEWAIANQETATLAIQWGYLSASEANIATTMIDAQTAQELTDEINAAKSENDLDQSFKPGESKPRRSTSSELKGIVDDFSANGMTYEQIGQKYGLTSGAVEQRLRRYFGGSPAAAREGLRSTQV